VGKSQGVGMFELTGFDGGVEPAGEHLQAVGGDRLAPGFPAECPAALVEADAPDPFAALETGVQWYLDECLRSKELQRVGLYEGRRALGWEAWREAIAAYGLQMLAGGLNAAMEAGQLEHADPLALAHMILALLHEAATMNLTAPDPLAERARTGQAVATIVAGLRKR